MSRYSQIFLIRYFFIAESQRSLMECVINGVPLYLTFCNMYLPWEEGA